MLALEEKTIPDSGTRMGRPPLGKKADDTKPTQVRFEAAMRARIDTARGELSMGAFIRSAVEEKLARKEKGE